MTQIKDGDQVVLTKPCKVDQYWFCPEHMSHGTWEFAYLLPGAVGTVIRANTPCVMYNPNTEPSFFANVDVTYMGLRFRVREFHDHFRRLPNDTP